MRKRKEATPEQIIRYFQHFPTNLLESIITGFVKPEYRSKLAPHNERKLAIMEGEVARRKALTA